MCGIVGIWKIDGETLREPELDRFTDSLAHRGPDGRGTFIDSGGYLGLGHRRLAILDITSSGHQPMSYGGKRYWITFNGEIYNFIELREQLTKLGHYFSTESDTEVILAAYAQWGQDCQFKLNGMWAFAIWDIEEKFLFLSRDRFGVKPLYFLRNKNYFLFASELKAFMALPSGVRPDFNLEMIARMKNEESIEQTLLEGVKNLNGGCCLSIGRNGSPRIEKWWDTGEHLEEVPKRFEDQVEQYKEIFYDACRIRMRSDVPIGTALSGGLDSSSVLCSMVDARKQSTNGQRLAADWQKAFVLVYSGTTHDETTYAKQVVKQTAVTPIYKEISPSLMSLDDIESAIFGFEAIQSAEPSIGPWLIYREMKREGVSVSMDGLGGDETLAGYHEYLPIAMKDAIWPVPNVARWQDLKIILSGLYEEEFSEGSKSFIPTLGSVVQSLIPGISEGKVALVNCLEKSPWLLDRARNSYRHAKQSVRGLTGIPNDRWVKIEPAKPTSNFRHTGKFGRSYLQRYLYDDFHYGTNARSLRNFDRMSMAHGVESRAPFMDWRLVCFSFSLPSDSKLGSGSTKRILRDAMRGVLPEPIRIRKGKLGFSSPMPVWYQYGLRNQVLDTINSRQFLESDIWNGSVIRDFTEYCFRKGDYSSAVKSWKYIQALLLMNSFERAARVGNLTR
jgi:asparagine synthase (glutamine-hydrolysing)